MRDNHFLIIISLIVAFAYFYYSSRHGRIYFNMLISGDNVEIIISMPICQVGAGE